MRTYPLEYEAKKEILFYPERPDSFDADTLEIGPGRGDFLLSVARKYPERKFVAVEIRKKRHTKIIPRIERLGINNILLICGNAKITVPRYFESESFEKIYVLFPDPWPKKRHRLHRLLSIEFIELMTGMLRPGGLLFAATDFWPYASWVVDNASQISSLKNLGKPYFTTLENIDDYSPSFFEQKWRNEGRAIYYMRFEKV